MGLHNLVLFFSNYLLDCTKPTTGQTLNAGKLRYGKGPYGYEAGLKLLKYPLLSHKGGQRKIKPLKNNMAIHSDKRISKNPENEA